MVSDKVNLESFRVVLLFKLPPSNQHPKKELQLFAGGRNALMLLLVQSESIPVQRKEQVLDHEKAQELGP